MKDVKKQDLRVIKTREAIYKALEELVCEMDANKITIQKLTDRARISYKTFYLHYESIDALFASAIDSRLNRQLFVELDKLPADASLREQLGVFFEFLVNQGDYAYKVLAVPSYRKYVKDALNKLIEYNRAYYYKGTSYTEAERHIIESFMIETSLNFYMTWIKDDKQVPLEKLVTMASDLLMNGVGKFIK